MKVSSVFRVMPSIQVKDLKEFNPEGMISTLPLNPPVKPQSLDEFMQTPVADHDEFLEKMGFWWMI